MPLLLLIIDIKVAAPIVAVMSMTIALFIIIRDRQSIAIKEAWRMILFAVLGVPIGLFFLSGEYKDLICIVLGAIVVLFSLFKLLSPNLLTLKNDKYAPIYCLLSGILGGAYNVNGPPVVIYATMRKWEAKKLRAMLQAIFLPLNITIIIGHTIAGNFNSASLGMLAYGVIPIVAGMGLGSLLNNRINGEKFIKVIYVLLIAIGIYLIARHIF